MTATIAPAAPPEEARNDASVTLVRRFAALRLPLVEAALAGAVRGLGEPFANVSEAVRAAVGVGGGGGRRWRPLLTLAAGEACGAGPEQLAPLAAAVELTHTASLLLDDLPCMDDSATRRGRPATHRRLGSGLTILMAVGLLGKASELLAGAPRGSRTLVASWGRMIGLCGMSGGQVADLSRRDGATLRGEARRLHRRKTTALASFALAAGARAAGASPTLVDGLDRFGRDLGWAYQLADDAQDDVQDGGAGRGCDRSLSATRAVRLRERGERTLLAAAGAYRDELGVIVAFGRSIVPGPHAEAGRR